MALISFVLCLYKKLLFLCNFHPFQKKCNNIKTLDLLMMCYRYGFSLSEKLFSFLSSLLDKGIVENVFASKELEFSTIENSSLVNSQ